MMVFRSLFGWNSDKVMGRCILILLYLKLVALQGFEHYQRVLTTKRRA